MHHGEEIRIHCFSMQICPKKPAFEAMVMAAKGEEFSMTPEKIAVEAKDMLVTFEPFKEDGKTKTVTPQDIGAVSRGSGHQSVITVVNEENHTEDAAIGFSLRVRRNENDASMKNGCVFLYR